MDEEERDGTKRRNGWKRKERERDMRGEMNVVERVQSVGRGGEEEEMTGDKRGAVGEDEVQGGAEGGMINER